MVLEAFAQAVVARERPVPEPGPGEVLVRVTACGVCGTDVKAQDGVVAAVQTPRILGHEVAGELVPTGQRVALYLYRGCGACRYCLSDRENMCASPGPRIGFERDGGFAEYLVCAAANAMPIPPDIADETAAILCDAAATARRAIERARIQAGQTVAVIGAGGLGSFAIQLAALAGAKVIAADVNPARLALARELGAEGVVDLSSTALPNGLDAALDFAGVSQSAIAGFEALAPDGILVVVGYDPLATLGVSTQTLARSQRWIAGSRGSTRADLHAVIDLVARRRLRAVVGDRYSLEQADAALARMRAGEGIGRAVIVPG